jgi:hypothetical protein
VKVKLSCCEKTWQKSLSAALQQKRAVELSDLDYTKDGAFCEQLAIEARMHLFFIARERVGIFSALPLKPKPVDRPTR